jgi:drug/metabolite transporter (DMT)-like permease
MLAIGAGASFATLGIFSKLFYEHGGRPFELLVLRFVGTALLLGALAAVRRRVRPAPRIVVFGLLLGAFQVGANYALLVGFERAPAGLVVLLFYVYPMLATVGGALLFGEEFGVRRAVVLVLGLAGIGLTVGAPSSAPTIGIVLGLVAGVCTAGYILGARHLLHGSSLEAVEMVTLMYAAPAVGLAIAASIHGFHKPQPAAFGWAAALILVSSVLAMTLFYGAVKLVGAGTASLLATVEPLVAVVLAYLVLGESLTRTQLGGGAVILGSVVALTLPERGRRRRRGALPVTHP